MGKINFGSVVTPTILSDGKSMDKAFELLSIDVLREMNRIPYATLVLLAGDTPQKEFAISDDSFFEPGKTIEIKLRYEDGSEKEVSVFKGLVVKHSVEAGEQGMLLSVEIKDAAVKMTRVRNNKIYKDKTDSDIISGLLSDNGLTAGKIPTTKTTHKSMVQYYCTDWDFMLSRAEANGLMVLAENGKISLYEIKISGSAKYTFEFGMDDITNFEIDLDANHQFAAIEAVAWDPKEQKLTPVSKASEFSLKQGNLSASKVAKSLGGASQTLASPVELTPNELKAWADASMAKSRMSLIRGHLLVPGSGEINPADVINIAGIGARFNGDTLITGVHHRVDGQGWQSNIQFGLTAERFSTQANILDALAAGRLPAINGLQVGIVTDIQDPLNELRVAIQLPALGATADTVWARLGSIYAGKDHGAIFIPEVGDEVVVGFFNDDPTQPVVLGSLYSGKNTPPKTPDEIDSKNLDKVIISKTGLTLAFIDADKPKVFIETPNKNTIILDDDTESIKLSDQHGNTITMSKDGIEIKSAKDFKIDASGNVEIKGAKVDVK